MRFVKIYFVVLSVLLGLTNGLAQDQDEKFSRPVQHLIDIQQKETEHRSKTWPRPTTAQLAGMLNSWLKGIEKSTFDFDAFTAEKELYATILFLGSKAYNLHGKPPTKVFGLLVVTFEQEMPLRSWVLFNRPSYGYVRGLNATTNPYGIGRIVVTDERRDRRLSIGVVAPIDLEYDVFSLAGVSFKQITAEQAKTLPRDQILKVMVRQKAIYYRYEINFF